MSATTVPACVVDENGVHSISVAEGVRFIWWIETEGDKQRLWFKIDAPSVLKKHYEQVSISERDDVISFPIN